ncbi:MAG: fluoride efflux transporter CrcB [Desulfurivibrionaceae bacterium]
MWKIIAVTSGGGIGALFRYLLFTAVHRAAPVSFPYGTLAVNLTGAFLIGYLWALFEGTRLLGEWRLFIFTGLLGGFTTFSTFTREAAQLIRIEDYKTAALYMLISNIAGIMLVFSGYFLARK